MFRSSLFLDDTWKAQTKSGFSDTGRCLRTFSYPSKSKKPCLTLYDSSAIRKAGMKSTNRGVDALVAGHIAGAKVREMAVDAGRIKTVQLLVFSIVLIVCRGERCGNTFAKTAIKSE